jgi:GntR family transcriptional repressor for pyruvate dehydrogenase complex
VTDGFPRIEHARTTTSYEVARHLLSYLLSGQLPPGGRLPSERQLTEAFGVGRSAVREALKSLDLLGIVEVRPGSGTYLKGIDSDLLPQVIEWGLLLGERRTTDLVEARHHIEVIVARLAATRRDEAAVADLREVVARMAAAGTPDAFVREDVAFHLRLSEAAGNTVLAEVLTSIRALLSVWIRRAIGTAGGISVTLDEHRAVCEAVAAGDPDAAAAAMEAHMAGASGRLRESLEKQRQEGAASGPGQAAHTAGP